MSMENISYEENISSRINRNIFCNQRRFSRLLTILIVFAIAIAILSGTVFLIKSLQPRPGLYNQSCENTNCLNILQLKCINNKCMCDSNYYYLKSCQKKKSFMEKCKNNLKECNEELKLKCIDGVCNCDKNSYWDDKSCQRSKAYFEQCEMNRTECLASTLLYCDSNEKKCLCQDNRS